MQNVKTKLNLNKAMNMIFMRFAYTSRAIPLPGFLKTIDDFKTGIAQFSKPTNQCPRNFRARARLFTHRMHLVHGCSAGGDPCFKSKCMRLRFEVSGVFNTV